MNYRMSRQQEQVKVETDYKMGRHFNGIVFSVVGLMVLIALAFLFFFYKGRHKVMPKPTPSSQSARSFGLHDAHHNAAAEMAPHIGIEAPVEDRT